jgi:hypothetical protein
VGLGWQPLLTVTNGPMVVLLPAASSWKAEPPLCTRMRVPASRLFMENWVPDSCDSTKSMISGAGCSKLTSPFGEGPPPSTTRFSNDSGRIGLGLVLMPALPLPPWPMSANRCRVALAAC